MSPTSIAALGAIAGVTIFLGLPVGRLGHVARRPRALLSSVATGILIFLVWDVLSHAWEPIDEALSAGETGAVVGYGAIFAAAFTTGLMGLVYLDRWFDDLGWRDLGRELGGAGPGPYTWWSWRGKAFDNDSGWRIDYQLATPDLADLARTAEVERADAYDQRWSDHAPVVVTYDL